MATSMQVLNTIWKQINIGTKLACGARNPTACSNGALQFQVERGGKYMFVELLPSDTYKVTLKRFRKGCDTKVLEEKEDVYCDQLSEIIYHMVNK
jgi:hypothetical protein